VACGDYWPWQQVTQGDACPWTLLSFTPPPHPLVERFEQLVRENRDMELERNALIEEVTRLKASRPHCGVGA
jgi:hypothetical protein